MRLEFNFIADKAIILPASHNEIIQGFIYKHLDYSLADFLHDEGYSYQKRKFKFFTFSRLIGEIRFIDGFFEIESPFKLMVASSKDNILQSLAENIVKISEFKLGSNTVYIESINVHLTPAISDNLIIRMLSPVTVYSTLKKADGASKTYYYNPMEKEFGELIKKNLIKKYFALYNREPTSDDFIIKALNVSKRDEKIIKYKNFIIKGWMGRYNLIGNPELLKLAYDTGIGSKNSQGFGCFEICRNENI